VVVTKYKNKLKESTIKFSNATNLTESQRVKRKQRFGNITDLNLQINGNMLFEF